MKRLIIIGAGGHGRVVSDIAKRCGYDEISFLDDAGSNGAIGRVSDHPLYKDSADFIVAVGNNKVREQLQAELVSNGCDLATLVHPNAVCGENVRIGKGTVVMPGAVINTGAVIGTGVIVNTCCSVDHDCVINDFCHISVGAHVAGTVKIGFRTMIGAGATVINNIDICDDCVIGAGAVVVKNISLSGKYVGVPARYVE